MEYRSAAFLFAMLFAVILLPAAAGRARQAPPRPPVYSLSVMPVADTPHGQYVWRLQGGPGVPACAFLTLDSPTLRQWVSRLPRGTEINYRSPWAGLPMLANLFKPARDPENDTRKPVADFKHFCESRGVLFCDRFPVL